MSNTKVYFICFWLITESSSEVNWTFNLKDKFKTQVSQFCDFGILSLKYTPGVYPLNLWATLGRGLPVSITFFIWYQTVLFCLSFKWINNWLRKGSTMQTTVLANKHLNVYTKINIDTLVILCKLIKPLM